ncbi:MAG: thermonuclease family protein [Syntrophales bacterium]|nr:thermonuclease family protein [Syntrophales bacterium]MDD5642547.1 thermonuclease family protein [Syntrophales bacterium]
MKAKAVSSFSRKTENGKRKTVFIILLLAAALAWGCGRAPQLPPQKAKVIQVIDGDTLVLAGERRVRLLSIDAPEMARKGRPAQFMAYKAKAYLAQLTRGKEVRLEYGQLRYDHYGRLLAHVFLADNTLVEAALLRQGLAHVYIHPPNIRYREVLLAAQKEAMDARRGIWRKALNQDEPFYLVNRNTLRFHRPGCPHAKKIAPANRGKISSLKQAYLEGLSPCRSCQP